MKNLLNSNYKKSQVEIKKIQEDMFNLISELYPICRSITGNGVRQSLDIIKKHIEIEKKEVATGTQVFDWNIPKEWNISNAYIIDPNGKKIIDFKKSNLHVMSYSTPIKKKIELEELKKHIHTIPTQPNIIPYITSYYNENWGFCMSQNQFNELESGEYEICIDSTLKNGSLTYGEYLIKGEIQDEFLLSCYICHPSLCNDNLSGVALLTYLAKHLKNLKPKFSYRFLFIPETIGAITWLNLNEGKIDKIKGGLVATCLGDSGNSTYKKSRRGDSKIDKIVSYVLKYSNSEHSIVDFYPYGSDERQFCSPGFNLPMGSLMRTPYRKFLEYHNSGDNLEFIKKDSLGDSFSKYLESIWMFDKDEKFLNVNLKCEPQLGKRGIYRNTGIVRTDMNTDEIEQRELAIFWILNFSDGKNSLLDISEKSGIPFDIIVSASSNLYENKLLKQLDDN